MGMQSLYYDCINVIRQRGEALVREAPVSEASNRRRPSNPKKADAASAAAFS